VSEKPGSIFSDSSAFLFTAQQALSLRKEELAKRRDRLKDAQNWLEQQLASSEPYDLLASEQSSYSTLQNDLKTVRANLAFLLDFIFPIDASTSSNSPLGFSISALNLPNSDFPASISVSMDEEVSSALGLTAQLVNILAAYLGVALYYPITPAGSRSYVADYISSIKGVRTCVAGLFAHSC
jgi:hypothetical protein